MCRSTCSGLLLMPSRRSSPATAAEPATSAMIRLLPRRIAYMWDDGVMIRSAAGEPRLPRKACPFRGMMMSMSSRMACVIILSCLCQTGTAGYGFDPILPLAPEAAIAQSVAIGDVSGDGRKDLIVIAGGNHPVYSGKVLVYMQTDEGDLAPPVIVTYVEEANPYDARVKLADLNNDGDLDIVVAAFEGLFLLANEGDLTFTPGIAPGGLVQNEDLDFMDVDLDGNLDIVTMSGWSGIDPLVVFYGDGQDGIRERVSFPVSGGRDVHLADINGDGVRDLVYLSDRKVFVHLHVATGFAIHPVAIPVRVSQQPFQAHLVVSDLNGDGRADLAVAEGAFLQAIIAIHLQQPDGSFRYKAGPVLQTHSLGTLLADDIDRDGWNDLMVTHPDAGKVGFFAGSANGFSAEAVFHTGTTNYDMQLQSDDINSDGLNDIVLQASPGGLSYLPGRVSEREADLGVYLGLGNTAVALRIENHGQSGSSDAHQVYVQLDLRFGSPVPGSLPEGCSVQPWSMHDLQLLCEMMPLAAGAYHALLFPLTIPPRTSMNRLSAKAIVYPGVEDLRADNNVAQKQLLIRPAGAAKGRRP